MRGDKPEPATLLPCARHSPGGKIQGSRTQGRALPRWRKTDNRQINRKTRRVWPRGLSLEGLLLPRTGGSLVCGGLWGEESGGQTSTKGLRREGDQSGWSADGTDGRKGRRAGRAGQAGARGPGKPTPVHGCTHPRSEESCSRMDPPGWGVKEQLVAPKI